MRLSPLVVIFLVAFIGLMGFGIIIPLLPLYARHYGAQPWQVGALSASYALMQTICAPLLGRWSDRIGRRPVLLLSIGGTVAGFILMGLAPSLALLFVARLIDGATGGNIAVAQAYISDISTPEERAKRVGMLGAAFGLGFIFGPAIGALLSSDGNFARPAFAAAALSGLSLLLALVALPEPPRERQVASERRPQLRQVLASLGTGELGLLLRIALLSSLAFVGFETSFALFAERRMGFDSRDLGYTFAYIGLLVALVQGLLVGRLVPRWGEERLLRAGAALLALGMLLLALAFDMAALLLALGVIALGNGLLDPTLTSLISKRGPAQQRGLQLGSLQSLHSLARVVAPLCATALLQAVGPEAPYLAATALLATAALLARNLDHERAKPPQIHEAEVRKQEQS